MGITWFVAGGASTSNEVHSTGYYDFSGDTNALDIQTAFTFGRRFQFGIALGLSVPLPDSGPPVVPFAAGLLAGGRIGGAEGARLELLGEAGVRGFGMSTRGKESESHLHGGDAYVPYVGARAILWSPDWQVTADGVKLGLLAWGERLLVTAHRDYSGRDCFMGCTDVRGTATYSGRAIGVALVFAGDIVAWPPRTVAPSP